MSGEVTMCVGGVELPKAAIAYLHSPQVTAGFHSSLMQLVAADLVQPAPVFGARVLGHGAPPYLNLGRNAVIKQFLDEYPRDVRALLSLDSDNTFTPDQAYELLSHLSPERPVVSGLYFAWNAEKFMPRPILQQYGKTLCDYPENSLEWSDHCGMGFCALDRGWLEDWRAAHGDTWFDFRGTGKTSTGGFAIEDRAFCERVWQTGKKVFVHTGIKIGHEKQVNVGEKLYRALRLQAAACGMNS